MLTHRFRLNSADEAHALRELLRIARASLDETRVHASTGPNVRIMCKRYARIASELERRITADR